MKTSAISNNQAAFYKLFGDFQEVVKSRKLVHKTSETPLINTDVNKLMRGMNAISQEFLPARASNKPANDAVKNSLNILS